MLVFVYRNMLPDELSRGMTYLPLLFFLRFLFFLFKEKIIYFATLSSSYLFIHIILFTLQSFHIHFDLRNFQNKKEIERKKLPF